MEKNRFITVLYCNEKELKAIEIKNTLKDMSKIVGEKFDMIENDDCVVIYNRRKNKLKESSINLKEIQGSFIIAGNNKANSDFISLTNEQINKYKAELAKDMQQQKEEDEMECE